MTRGPSGPHRHRRRSPKSGAFAATSALAMIFGVNCAADVVLPYDLTGFSRRSAPAHPWSIAILPLLDGRAPEDRAPARTFLYQGLEFEGTVLEDLGSSPLDRLTEVLARHLQHEGLFSRIELVRDVEQASNADLVLDGRVARFRGYVQSEADASRDSRVDALAGGPSAADPSAADPSAADPPAADPPAADPPAADASAAASAEPSPNAERPSPRRRVLAEVVLSDLRIRRMDGRRPTTVLMECDAGWSIDERRAVEDQRRAAWMVSAEALRVALDRYGRVLEGADLSGRLRVRDRVHLAGRALAGPEAGALAGTMNDTMNDTMKDMMKALARRVPPGWAFSVAAEPGRPHGWSVDLGCIEGRFVAQQTLRFHRLLGPFVPSVRVWACPAEIEAHYDEHAEFAAQYLGTAPRGGHFFAYSVGPKNWPGAVREVAEHFRAKMPGRGGRVLDIVPARAAPLIRSAPAP
ncbi:MAG: hypothetical protein IPK13_13385 [Deltaproteobacteria bacterium]|nr:hypothetical protein [Deltaproteobacteria bacterium]